MAIVFVKYELIFSYQEGGYFYYEVIKCIGGYLILFILLYILYI